jgi:hypothetical protein
VQRIAGSIEKIFKKEIDASRLGGTRNDPKVLVMMFVIARKAKQSLFDDY